VETESLESEGMLVRRLIALGLHIGQHQQSFCTARSAISCKVDMRSIAPPVSMLFTYFLVFSVSSELVLLDDWILRWRQCIVTLS